MGQRADAQHRWRRSAWRDRPSNPRQQGSGMRSIRFLASVTAIVVSCLVAVPGQALAAQHQNANIYVNWTFPTASRAGFGQNVDQELLIVRKAPSSYWPQLWKW